MNKHDHEEMAQAISDSFDAVFTKNHIMESLKIEGILREPTVAEFNEHHRFMELDEITVEDLQRFVYVYCGAGHRLRNLITDHHQIGSRQMTGGAYVLEELAEQLNYVNGGGISPHGAHVEYEILHPFTDGNGRSGRMIWHWMMKKKHGGHYHNATTLGFLHTFYYQTLEESA